MQDIREQTAQVIGIDLPMGSQAIVIDGSAYCLLCAHDDQIDGKRDFAQGAPLLARECAPDCAVCALPLPIHCAGCGDPILYALDWEWARGLGLSCDCA